MADQQLEIAFSFRKTRSTCEAMTLLQRMRKDLIDEARQIAIELIARDGETTSRRVLAEMEARGALLPGVADYWLGAVFRGSPFVWTGRFVTYSDHRESSTGRVRNIHERTIKVWTTETRA